MQKLVTICLSGSDFKHGTVEEHLSHYLGDGWRITSVCAAGSPSGDTGAVWIAVVLEKAQGATLAAQKAGAYQQVVEYPHSDEGKPVAPSGVRVGPDTPLKVGSRVLSFSQGRWWRAEVTALEPDGLVRLHFPGWDAKWDTVVPREELQVDPSAPGK